MSVENYPVRWVGQHAVIAFPEEVDITNAGPIRDRLLAVVNEGAAALVIDLTATTFCDSACVNTIVRAYRRAVASGSQMRLAIASVAVRRIFEITEINRLVPIYASLAEALAADSSPADTANTAPADGESRPADTSAQPQEAPPGTVG